MNKGAQTYSSCFAHNISVSAMTLNLFIIFKAITMYCLLNGPFGSIAAVRNLIVCPQTLFFNKISNDLSWLKVGFLNQPNLLDNDLKLTIPRILGSLCVL